MIGSLTPVSVMANNLTVSDATLTDYNSASRTVNIQFNVSWENSWRNATNHDALWLFVKYSTDSGASWNHALLKNAGTNPSGFSTGTGDSVEIEVMSNTDGSHVGAIVRRSSEGNGNVDVDGIEFVWDYAANGLTESDTARVQVFGIEMVYIPEGNFSVGDFNTSSSSLKSGSGNSGSDINPWSISNELSFFTNSPGFYYPGAAFEIPSAFPKGYQSFYAMKHEITEGQWVSFFNTLNLTQKQARDISFAASTNMSDFRNTFQWTGSGNATTTRPDRACSYLSWMDGVAYADWAALRPMTELEFEKAARGKNVQPVSGEFAWGNTQITQALEISSGENGSEIIVNSNNGLTANANYGNNANLFVGSGDGKQGPLRAGIFATATSTRTHAGAGFYGMMELSGNLYEQLVTFANTDGRVFQGTHGDGVLTTIEGNDGNASNADWPGNAEPNNTSSSTVGVTSAVGSGIRGGSWFDASDRLRISDRQFASDDSQTVNRTPYGGFRACRTAS